VNQHKLLVLRTSELQLGKFGYASDPTARVKGTFPFSVATGNASTAAVYFEVEPGCHLGTHTDSAEEILIFLEGTAEVTLGETKGQVTAGDMTLVPAMVPHGVRNIGEDTLRVFGCFSSNTVFSTFEEPLIPLGDMPPMPEATRTLVTPPPALVEMAPLATSTVAA
jgi:quercetin dioxygenase-like cupin family protein